MGIFNHVSKDKSETNIQSGTTRFDIILSDFAQKMIQLIITVNQNR